MRNCESCKQARKLNKELKIDADQEHAIGMNDSLPDSLRNVRQAQIDEIRKKERMELILARKVIEAARYAEEPTGKIFFGDVNNEVENRRANFRKALKAYDAGAKE